MNNHIKNFYSEFSDASPYGRFHRVIPLHADKKLSWEEVSDLAPTLPRGWFELSQLKVEDRIEFSREFWLSKLPFFPSIHTFLPKFFDRLDDVQIYLTQNSFEDPLEPELVYSVAQNEGFFHGAPPASQDVLLKLQNQLDGYILPMDYVTFLEIHNGFSKYTDTGIIKIENVLKLYKNFQEFLREQSDLHLPNGESVNPRSLIPFYESFGQHCYQCFYGDWYPEQEMGNVYYSGIERTLSDISVKGNWMEQMAFPNFMDWLVFYLEPAIEGE